MSENTRSNSRATGSSMSSATSLRVCEKGWPAFSARLMTSSASGICSSNFARRAARSFMILISGRKKSATAPVVAHSGARVRFHAHNPPPIPKASDNARTRYAGVSRPLCSMIRDRRSIPGSVSRERSGAESCCRAFSRSNEAKSPCAPAVVTVLRRARRRLRIRPDSPNTGTTIPWISRKTAEKTRIRNSQGLLMEPLSPQELQVARVAEQVHGQIDAALAQSFFKRRHDAGRQELALYRAILVQAAPLEPEELRHRDDLPLHAIGLLHTDNPATAILLALDLDDDVDRRCDLGPQRLGRKSDARHRHHVLDAAQRLARVVRVNGRQ